MGVSIIFHMGRGDGSLRMVSLARSRASMEGYQHQSKTSNSSSRLRRPYSGLEREEKTNW